MPNSTEPEPPLPELTPKPADAPWYVHVAMTVATLLAVLLVYVFLPPMFYFFVWATVIPGIYLAVAGKGNRVYFLTLLSLVNVIAFVGIAMLEIKIKELGVAGGILVCILVVLWPAMLLWLAHTLNIRQRKL